MNYLDWNQKEFEEYDEEAVDDAEVIEEESEEPVKVVTRPKKQVKKVTRTVGKVQEHPSVLDTIKGTFHGFFVVATLLAVAAAVYIFLNGSTEVMTIQLPEIQITQFRVAVAAVILFVLGCSLTKVNRD